MATQSLREALLAIPGVAEADIDETSGSPSGVRVTLAPDADGRVVGVEVQRVLATHGLRSRITPGDEPAPPASPAGNGAAGDDMVFVPPPPPEAPPPSPVSTASDEVATGAEIEAEAIPGPAAPPPAGFDLASISISETADAVAVTATATDGKSHTVEGVASEEGLLGAVTEAVGALAVGDPPTIVSVDAVRTAGSEIVTVVLEDPDGRRSAGAAVVVADRAFAAARATVAAIRSR